MLFPAEFPEMVSSRLRLPTPIPDSDKFIPVQSPYEPPR